MLFKDKVDSVWSTFFNLSEEDKKKYFQQIKLQYLNFESADIAKTFSSLSNDYNDNFFIQALKIELLDFCINEKNFALEILSAEEYEKSIMLFKRKQYESKLLNRVLKTFLCFLNYFNYTEKIYNYLERDINKRKEELVEQETDKIMMPLKKQMEKVASGVKGCCYLLMDASLYAILTIESQLNDHLKEKYGYDFNQCNKNSLGLLVLFENHYKNTNEILQKALLNDEAYWTEHKGFDVIHFINIVCKYNSFNHAKKIIDFIIEELRKTYDGKKIIENSLPLAFLDKALFISELEKRTFRFTFARFNNEYDLSIVSSENLLYPLSTVKDVEKKLKEGKQLVDELWENCYPDNFEEVKNFIVDEINKYSQKIIFISESTKGENGDEDKLPLKSPKQYTLVDIFDFPTFGYFGQIYDKDAVVVYCQDYFSSENLWNRFYLKAYNMLVLTKDKSSCFANLFEVYFDLFQYVEEKTQIKTVHQRNMEGRKESFQQLKTILNKYGVKISEDFEKDYVISLLDRKVANREEWERFPALEQLGDAVYGFAVAEMLFYNPNGANISKLHNEYISADFQIAIAQKLGIDKLYLSARSLPKKYIYDMLINTEKESYTINESVKYGNAKKYIADSLEMIIGTICNDCGYKTAIDFTKKIVKETYPELFVNEVHWQDNQNTEIDRDYWSMILPAPYSSCNSAQQTLMFAFNKFYLCYVLKTDDKKTRDYLTNLFGNELFDEKSNICEINKVFYEYLHKGLDSAIEKYFKSVKEKYELKKK